MSTKTPLEAIQEISRVLGSIPSTPNNADNAAAIRHMIGKYGEAIIQINYIVAPFVAEPTPTADTAQGALFPEPAAKPLNAIAEGR